MRRFLVIFLLMAVSSQLLAQRSRRIQRDSWDRVAINRYFAENKPATAQDSAFYAAFRYLNYEIRKDTANLSLSALVEIVRDNRPNRELKVFAQFCDTVVARQNRFDNAMSDARMRWYQRRMLDTVDVSSADSNFLEIIELIAEDTTNYDSLTMLTTPYTKNLSDAVRQNLSDIRKMPVFNQIRGLRNDTTLFYLVNLNGDSLRFRLYDGSPRVIRTNIKDLAGNDEPVLIRDIHRNSFRLLINDSPEIEVDYEGKTKQVFSDMLERNANRSLTITRRVPPEDPSKWKLGGKISLDAYQMALRNWIRGGENTIALQTSLELYANYKNGYHIWESKGLFKYGAIRQGGKSMRTNEDKIIVASNYGYKAFKRFYYSAQVEFKSQFAPIYEYNGNTKTVLLSKFLAPATLTLGAGLEYKPNANNSLIISPLTSKNTFVLSDTVNHMKYSVKADRYVRSETGLYVKSMYKNKIWKNIELSSVAEFFSNYFNNPQNVDVDWTLELTLPINYYVRTTVSTEIVYDDDQEIPVYDNDGKKVSTTKATQLKELIKLGVVFKF